MLASNLEFSKWGIWSFGYGDPLGSMSVYVIAKAYNGKILLWMRHKYDVIDKICKNLRLFYDK